VREQLHVHSHEEDAKEAKEKATATATAKGHKGKGGGGTGGRRDGATDTKPPAASASAAAYGVTFHMSTPAGSVGGPQRTPEGPSKAHPPPPLASTLQPVDVNVSPGGLSVPSLSPAPGPGPVATGFALPTVDPLEVTAGPLLPTLLCFASPRLWWLLATIDVPYSH